MYGSLYENLQIFGVYLGLSATDPRIMIAHLVRAGLGFIGILFLFLILVSGLTWMTSGGNEEKIAGAKKTIANAIIGLIIIFSAYGIVQFVLNALVSATTQPPIVP